MSIESKIWQVHSDVEGIVKSGVNPHFRSNYVNLNDLLEELTVACNKVKLAFRGGNKVTESGHQVLTVVISDLESGEQQTHEVILRQTDPQKLGSEITYMRRYVLINIFQLQGLEDCDAETAEGRGSYKSEGNVKLTPPSSPAPTRRAPFGRGGK